LTQFRILTVFPFLLSILLLFPLHILVSHYFKCGGVWEVSKSRYVNT
jgi:hypothetical protein